MRGTTARGGRAVQELVVDLRRDDAVRAARTVRWVRQGAAVVVVAGAVVVLLGVVDALRTPDLGTGSVVLAVVVAVLVCALAARVVRDAREARTAERRIATATVVLRVSMGGIWWLCLSQADHVFLPWDAVEAVRVNGSYLQVVPVAWVRRDHPRSRGLWDDVVWRRLHRRFFQPGIGWRTEMLHTDLAAVDAAVTHFSAGRVRLSG